ncbi:MAG: hypothetical protein AAB499_01385 [Patescibacteria group bacterium]
MEILPGRSYLLLSGPVQESDLPGLAIDKVIIDGGVAIKDLRFVIGQMSQKPFGRLRLLYLTGADQLSEICQSALLKLLEDPPAGAAIILQTTRPTKLLPTIASRLQVINWPSTTPNASLSGATIDQLSRSADRLAMAASCAQLLSSQSGELSKDPNHLTLEKIDLLEEAIFRLDHNANWRLTLDYLLLRWPANK